MGEFGAGFIPRHSAENMLQTMNTCNTILTLFCGHEALFNPAVGELKDLDVVRKYPDRFRAYHAVFSLSPQPKIDIERIKQNPEVFVGFKFHCDYPKVSLSDPRHEPYWEYADQNGLPVLVHTWGGSRFNGPEEVEKIVTRYRERIFIAGHSMHGDWEKAVQLANRYQNLYLELTGVLDDRGALDLFIEKVGSKKILFGTDLPWFSTHHGIGAVLSAEMTDEERKDIFYRNGNRILSRFDWFKPWKDRLNFDE